MGAVTEQRGERDEALRVLIEESLRVAEDCTADQRIIIRLLCAILEKP